MLRSVYRRFADEYGLASQHGLDESGLCQRRDGANGMSQAFDREWQLGELLDGPLLEQAGSNLRRLLAGDLAITDAAGHILWGIAPARGPAPALDSRTGAGWLPARPGER